MKVSQDPGTDRVLEAFQELVGEAGGFVEAEAGFRIGWILMRVILDSLEESIHDDEMKVKMWIEAWAEAVEKAHGTHGCGLRGRGTGFSEGNRQGYRKGRPPGPYRKRGFHLAAASQEQIQEILGGFRSLGVEQVGATHCSGDLAISMFQGAYGEDFRPLGAGRVLTFPLKSSG
jgi:hypothetical protein